MPKYEAVVKFDSKERVITADTPPGDVVDMICADEDAVIANVEREYDIDELSERLEDAPAPEEA